MSHYTASKAEARPTSFGSVAILPITRFSIVENATFGKKQS